MVAPSMGDLNATWRATAFRAGEGTSVLDIFA